MGNPSKLEESRRNQIILSYSYVFPLAIQTLLFSVVIGTQITRNLSEHGHGRIVYFSLSFPVFGFLIGYLFFKRTVKEK
jgi:hypothetical protein